MKISLSSFVRVAAVAAAFSFAAAGSSYAAGPVTVGGAPMYAEKNIVENAVNSKDHTTLVAAVKAAGGKVKVDKANVGKADVEASDGVIHVIDTVLLPPQ